MTKISDDDLLSYLKTRFDISEESTSYKYLYFKLVDLENRLEKLEEKVKKEAE